MSDNYSWRQKARRLFPSGASLQDVQQKGTVDKKREGEVLCGGEFVYLATYPRDQGQKIRIFLRDCMGIQCMAAGRKEERIYVSARRP